MGGRSATLRFVIAMRVGDNVVSADTLRAAQADPDSHRDFIVRVTGYFDYFCDISSELQNEIIARTEHERF